MKHFIYLLLFSSILSSQTKNEGYVIYQVTLTEAYGYYSEEYKMEAPELYADDIKQDSIINTIELGTAFKDGVSNSFRTKQYVEGSNNDYSALNKINGDPDYHYSDKTKKADIYLDYWDEKLIVLVSLKNKWKINYSKTKLIDGKLCYYAVYQGEGLWWKHKDKTDINAWFTTEIPLPYGPLHFNNLPRLILEMNDENVRYTAKKVVFDDTYSETVHKLDVDKSSNYTEEEFIKSRAGIRRRYKRIMTGN